MCGIAGVHFKKGTNAAKLSRFEELVRLKQHMRGPDEFNRLDLSDDLFFFHNMLSIIDIGNARQPMEDDKGVITYNGEVYNYRSLRIEGEEYIRNSDTEVLLKGLNDRHIEFLKNTNSMFGFGYFNKEKKVLTICRDRVGIKQLYFIDNDEVFAFASTITPLVIFSEKKLNQKGLAKYYFNRAFKAPDTIFSDIHELPAGSYMEFDVRKNRRGNIIKWWDRKPVQELYKDEEETLASIESLLNDSIKNRLVADVPVGLFLSGGVDSSLIAALTAKQTSGLNAFTVAFHDDRFDESVYAKRVCEKFGIGYNEIRVNAGDFINSIENWISIQDDIVADPSALLLYKISEYAHSLQYRVLLAGEGSDELFAGYNSYKYFGWSQKIYKTAGHVLPFKGAVNTLFRKNSRKYNFVYNSLHEPRFYGTAMIFEPHLMTRLMDGFDIDSAANANNLKCALDLDIKDRIPNDLLTRSDRSTSYASLELRVPFLAHQLVDYSAGISGNLLVKGGEPKYLIKKLASRHLDRDIIYRKKVGFDLPLRSWLSHELRDLLESSMANSIQEEFIDMAVIRECYDLHLNNGYDYSTKLWAFMCLELSYRSLNAVR